MSHEQEPQLQPEIVQTPEQMQLENVAAHFMEASQLHELSEQEAAQLSQDVTNILQTAVNEPDKLGTEIMSDEKVRAYHVAEAYVELASLSSQQGTEKSAEVFKNASELLSLDPSIITLKRDYKNTMKLHKMEEADHISGVKGAFAEIEGRQARVQQKLHDAHRKIVHNQKLEAAKADEKARAETRKAFYKLFPSEPEEVAAAYVEAYHGEKPVDPNVVDTAALKLEREQKAQAASAEREKTANARKEFELGYAETAEDKQVQAEAGASELAEEAVNREKNAQKNDILEEFGFRAGTSSIKLVGNDPNSTSRLHVADAFDDADGNLVFKVMIIQDLGKGKVRKSEVMTSNAQKLLKKLEATDKYLQSAGRKRPKGNGDLNAEHNDYLDELGAAKRDELRAIYNGEPATAGDPATLEQPAVVVAASRRERAANKVRSFFGRAKMLAVNIQTGAAFERLNTRKGRLVAAGVGIVAAALVVRGVMDHDSADNMRQLTVNPIEVEPPEMNSDPTSTADAKAPEASPEVTEAWTDKVNPNDGITNTFLDYARSSGKDISPERAFEIFNDAKEAGLITEDNISGISKQDVIGGVGFSSPGSTTLSPDLLEFLNKELDKSQ